MIWIIVAMTFSGCSDGLPDISVSEDGNTFLSLRVPVVSMSFDDCHTRDEDIFMNNSMTELARRECDIHTLHLIGISSDSRFFYRNLDLGADNQRNNVRVYNIDVDPGNYCLYLIANVALDSATEALVENGSGSTVNVKNAIEEYSVKSLPVLSEGLPMCWKQTVEITEGENKEIRADLDFACAKARLTILYDSDSFSENTFGKGMEFGFKSICAHNIKLPIRLYVDADMNEFEDAEAEYNVDQDGFIGGHYRLDNDLRDMMVEEIIGSYSMADIENDPLNCVSDPDNRIDAPATAFAFQTTCYLPECVGVTEESGRTMLDVKGETADGREVTYSFPLVSLNEESQEFRRGHFYDIVAKITSMKDQQTTYVIYWNSYNIYYSKAWVNGVEYKYEGEVGDYRYCTLPATDSDGKWNVHFTRGEDDDFKYRGLEDWKLTPSDFVAGSDGKAYYHIEDGNSYGAGGLPSGITPPAAPARRKTAAKWKVR